MRERLKMINSLLMLKMEKKGGDEPEKAIGKLEMK